MYFASDQTWFTQYHHELVDRRDDEVSTSIRAAQSELVQCLNTTNAMKQRLHPTMSRITNNASRLNKLNESQSLLLDFYKTYNSMQSVSSNDEIQEKNDTDDSDSQRDVQLALATYSSAVEISGDRRRITGFIPDPVDLGGIPRKLLHQYHPKKDYMQVLSENNIDHTSFADVNARHHHFIHPQHPHNPEYQNP